MVNSAWSHPERAIVRCRICGRSDVVLHYCGRCGVYLCERCRHNWPARIAAAIRDHLGGRRWHV